MKNTNQSLGDLGEIIALQALATLGYSIIERNWFFQGGEIDAICLDEDTLVFVEVKTRSGDQYGTPEEAVTKIKKQRILRGALMYLAGVDEEYSDWRVDVVAIELNKEGKVRRLAIYENAIRVDDS